MGVAFTPPIRARWAGGYRVASVTPERGGAGPPDDPQAVFGQVSSPAPAEIRCGAPRWGYDRRMRTTYLEGES